jgi:phenylacetic acid degradation operon negative regulatory protein
LKVDVTEPMDMPRSRPSDTLLDLLRGAGRRGRSARSLITVAALFGLGENTVRVTLSRLVARGVVESPDRGRYRLTARTDSLNEFVERWRQGEARVRPWCGHWLFAHPTDDDTGNAWALEALGFREVRAGLFARPDNLTITPDELRNLGRGIGLAPATLLVAGRVQGEPETEAWRQAWDPATLDRRYSAMIGRLSSSGARLPQLPQAEARLESFRLGGEAIHLLAKDPLLPDGFVDVTARAGLWRAMVAYEAIGIAAWAGAFQETAESMPIPQLAAGG